MITRLLPVRKKPLFYRKLEPFRMQTQALDKYPEGEG